MRSCGSHKRVEFIGRVEAIDRVHHVENTYFHREDGEVGLKAYK